MHAIYQGLLRLDAELTHQTSLGAKTERLAGALLALWLAGFCVPGQPNAVCIRILP